LDEWNRRYLSNAIITTTMESWKALIARERKSTNK